MSLYLHSATLEAASTTAYKQDAATGFIQLNGLLLEVVATVRARK